MLEGGKISLPRDRKESTINVADAKSTASTLWVRHLCPSMRASVADITSGHIAIDASENSIFTHATLMFHLFYIYEMMNRGMKLFEKSRVSVYRKFMIYVVKRGFC